MKNKTSVWTVFLMLLVLSSVAANIVMTAKLSGKVDAVALCIKKKPLPCAAIPIRYVMDEPECANKLLQAMNVTNVHVLSRNATVLGMDEGTVEGSILSGSQLTGR